VAGGQQVRVVSRSGHLAEDVVARPFGVVAPSEVCTLFPVFGFVQDAVVKVFMFVLALAAQFNDALRDHCRAGANDPNKCLSRRPGGPLGR
jgi:hypothetical protein